MVHGTGLRAGTEPTGPMVAAATPGPRAGQAHGLEDSCGCRACPCRAMATMRGPRTHVPRHGDDAGSTDPGTGQGPTGRPILNSAATEQKLLYPMAGGRVVMFDPHPTIVG